MIVRMDLYHADIRLPDGFTLPKRVVELFWTNHARTACVNDRYGLMNPFPVLDLGQCDVIEVGVLGTKVVKIVLRTEYDDEFDIVIVVIPQRERWTVKTVWLNRWDDLHRTLDRSKYVN